jgi:hypothetical protein
MADQRLKELRGVSRRNFLRWSATAAACMGLERSRLLNVINDNAGSAAADMAACSTTNRHIHVLEGTGGLSNWTQVFPVPAVIKGTDQNGSHYAIGKGVDATGYDRPFVNGPDTPWQTNSTWKVSAFLGGQNQTHTDDPDSSIKVGNNGLIASAAAIQQANPTLIPVLMVGGYTGGTVFGGAAGAPAISAVPGPNQLLGLFNSQASRALLAGDTNGPMQESYYKAFLGLNAAAGRTTTAKAYATGKLSMNLLAKNLSSQLTPTAGDLAAFGIDGNSPSAVQNMSRSMITTMKAFSLGLTSMLVVRGFNNDPHGLFAGGNNDAMTVASSMGKMLNGLYALGKSLQDPACASKTLADALVFSVSGDTFKQPFNRNNWDDGTPGGTNLLYVAGAGYVKTGWFGELVDGQTVHGWDIATGNTNATMDFNQARGDLAGAGAAAALFAVARGDMRRVRDFYNGPDVSGIVNLNVTG